MLKQGLTLDGLWLDMNEVSNFCSGDYCTDPGAVGPNSVSVVTLQVLFRSAHGDVLCINSTARHPVAEYVSPARVLPGAGNVAPNNTFACSLQCASGKSAVPDGMVRRALVMQGANLEAANPRTAGTCLCVRAFFFAAMTASVRFMAKGSGLRDCATCRQQTPLCRMGCSRRPTPLQTGTLRGMPGNRTSLGKELEPGLPQVKGHLLCSGLAHCFQAQAVTFQNFSCL